MAEKSAPYRTKTTEEQQDIRAAEDNVNVWRTNFLSYVRVMEIKMEMTAKAFVSWGELKLGSATLWRGRLALLGET